mmetsp:Transcript_26964/g.50996  ORF Transcript_26964/g.50996 Transcript_26964/m.50996 type:complete len:327 (-) Transcript_26964:278-1258(-)|eukprot:CAMPEP_0114234616 /NCGR_PEP_ID=MMETSP0058-20121206/5804_1 /TAXON_ID=36894 /ORGANISM="Pyramimonas parkeae, CCMP726" /LENGTH=326 /DNA_ID=CAMNT_0001346307 /DNA_START=153 /DNA_END=1133 /DNA_ORIENTATION=-
MDGHSETVEETLQPGSFHVVTKKTLTTEQDVRNLFLDLDVNGDGLLSLKDLREAMQDAEVDWSSAGLDLNKPLDEILHIADSDGDRMVTFEEFWRLISVERVPADVEVDHVRRIFEQINQRGDGRIDRGEVQRSLRNPDVDWESLGIDRSTYDRHIFVSADKNGDNRIHFEEFWEFVLESIQHRAHEQAVAASKQVSLVDISQWGTQEVADWISELGYPQYRACFEVNNFHGPKLLLLTMDMLPSLNITKFDHMREIMRALRRLKGQREDAVETYEDHLTRKLYSPHKKAVPERTLRFGTATDFAIESAAVEGGYSKPTYVFVPRV